ncbi:DUF2493 domain-containing protein [Mesorhizobium sp. YIM 152430]|uniref:DUF2493 domain-containing protein n=1 Tax=Mesorhizobium sp. YIM 152430 TaxID=3031761 RepID=UPI0023D983E9|nr:DUF2493 domain-containing protein [Mesorhizobium sp. YIM 152430]MDF1599683.1 DUF2493 domain-containing protein [Mesorhizobium sp. YIM 152430]
MRVLICGGRDFGTSTDEKHWMLDQLTRLNAQHGFSAIIEGGAPGADTGARIFGEISSIPVETFRADWRKHGPAAGPIRNQRMIDEGKPDVVIAFPGGRGTADMVRRARTAGLRVIEASAKENPAEAGPSCPISTKIGQPA